MQAYLLRNEGNGAIHWPLTSSDIDDFRNGRAYIVIYGEFNYDDIFHVHHWVHFADGSLLLGEETTKPSHAAITTAQTTIIASPVTVAQYGRIRDMTQVR